MGNETGTTTSYSVEPVDTDNRIDLYLAERTEETRSRIQSLIREGNVTVNSSKVKTSHKLKAGDTVTLNIPPSEPYLLEPEPMDLPIVYEDSWVIVIDKPPGLVVHPAPGHNRGTLVHGLLYHCKDLAGIGGVLRPGIVHRLDKDTSGLLVAAKNDTAHNFLSGEFKNSKVSKRYLALVHGIPKGKEGTIDLPISRHPVKRKEMAVSDSKGKNALTLWEIKETLGDKFALLTVTIKTGRTHQIRVHMSHTGHPIVGDPVYGHKSGWWKKNTNISKDIYGEIKRQMLHAEYLGFTHPETKKYMNFSSPVPSDMDIVLKKLKSVK